MSKSDFEYYEVPGLDVEYVVPKPECNPYRGKVDPIEVGHLAAETVQQAVTDVLGDTPEYETIDLEVANRSAYFYNRTTRGVNQVLWQRVNMTIDLPDEGDAWWSTPIQELQDKLGKIGYTPTRLHPVSLTGVEGGERPLLFREAHTEASLNLFNWDTEEPENANLAIRQVVPLRAYEWLPGPTRISKTGNSLAPVYGPRLSGLVIAQFVEINGINPRVEQAT